MRHHLNQKRLVEKIEKRIEALIAATNLLAPQADTSDETGLSLKKVSQKIRAFGGI